MGGMASSLLVLVVAVYAAVATAYLEARRRREAPPLWARIAGALGVAVHLLGLIALSAQTGRSPFAGTSQSLSFLAFALAGLYLVMEATSRVATHGGGFYVCAAVLAALGVPGLVEAACAPVASVRDPIRTFHVGLSLLGTAAVLAGGLLAGGYLGTYRRVKRATLAGGAEGPSLRGFERLERRATVLALLFLGPALVFGSRSGGDEAPPEGLLVLVVLTVALFLLMLAAGWIWWFRPLRGRLASWLNLAAMLLAILATILVHPLVLGSGA
jgi:hypothetical protein